LVTVWNGNKVMKQFFYFRMILFSFLAALILSTISLICLKLISETLIADYRSDHMLFMARAIERSSNYQPITKINVDKYPAPPRPPDEIMSFLDSQVPPIQSSLEEKNRRVLKPSFWLVSASGKILSSNNREILPVQWERLVKPGKVHVIESNDDIFSFTARTFVVQLKTEPTTYLVSQDKRTPFGGPLLVVQGILTFTTVSIAVFLALYLTAYYLRRKSREARNVLARLEEGDLKARFDIKRFDEFGSLLLDFNRMAQEIEHLVKRLTDSEKTRSNLLQELGHDLRTPLTSLNTSFETIQMLNHKMSADDRSELFSIINGDINYFKDLLEKLMIIATIDVPIYKSSAESIDLQELISSELKSRQSTSESLSFKLDLQSTEPFIIKGDEHLLVRLLKNALDNSSRYARKNIEIILKRAGDNFHILIQDDGPGLTHESLQSFGKRREIRTRTSESSNFSLGLGSVIMKTIVEAHGGSIEMRNSVFNGSIKGACLLINLRRKKT
jgi:signal transduction histidine kinase